MINSILNQRLQIMKKNITNSLLEAIILFLKETGKSEDVAALLMGIEVDEPSLLHDFLIELSLTASPIEEEGLGCYSLDLIEKAYKEFKETGTTNLLNSLK